MMPWSQIHSNPSHLAHVKLSHQSNRAHLLSPDSTKIGLMIWQLQIGIDHVNMSETSADLSC